MGVDLYSKIDKFMQEFCKDSIRALRKEDKILKENFEKTRYKSFYSDFSKGIYFRSMTEPILKYIIFKELIKKHKMWPEAGWFYKDRSVLDLGISSPYNPNADDIYSADVAIEMKWGGINKNGVLHTWSQSSLQSDIIKMINNCEIANKYFMQFIVIKKDEREINITNIRKEVKDKHEEINLRPIFCEHFKTLGIEPGEYWKFYIILWKVY